MFLSLKDAPLYTDLILVKVDDPDLTVWLQRLGLYLGSHCLRHNESINYYPARVRCRQGDVVVPARLGIRVIVHLDGQEMRLPLVEMQKQASGHVESIAGNAEHVQALARLGIVEDAGITFIRALPHMNYTALIDGRERTRLSEGEAARIWGKESEDSQKQFYFASKNTPFTVLEIIGSGKMREHLASHGVVPHRTLTLESIESTQELHRPLVDPITLSSTSGLRFYLDPQQAERIFVRSVERQETGHSRDQSCAPTIETL